MEDRPARDCKTQTVCIVVCRTINCLEQKSMKAKVSILSLLLLCGCEGAMAQYEQKLPEFRNLEITGRAVVKIEYLHGDSVPGRLRIENRRGILSSPWLQYDEQTGTLSVYGMEATLMLNPDYKGLQRIAVGNSSRLETNVAEPLSSEDLHIRVSDNAVARLFYQAIHLNVTAVKSASFQGYGSGEIQSQTLRCDGGAYIASAHADTVEVMTCVAAGMGIVDARESPARLAFDTLFGNASVTVNALESKDVVKGNGLLFNVRDENGFTQDSLLVASRSYNREVDRSYGKPVAIKGLVAGDADEDDILDYFDALDNDWADGKAIYLEDFFFWGKRQKERPRFRGQWMGLEFGFACWGSDYAMNMQMPADYQNLDLDFQKSGSVGWNVFQVSVGFKSPHWGFVTGAGFLWENYFFSYPNTVLSKENHRLAADLATDPGRRYIKSKLGVSYFRIPLLFEYTNAKGMFRSVHVSAGVIPSVLMCSWTKQVYREDGKRTHDKRKGDFYVNPFRLDAVVYAGWGPLSLYFRYTPTHFFRAGKATDITPFGFGFLLGFH